MSVERIISEIRRLELTVPGVKKLVVDKRIMQLLVLQFNTLPRKEEHGPVRMTKTSLFLGDIEIQEEQV